MNKGSKIDQQKKQQSSQFEGKIQNQEIKPLFIKNAQNYVQQYQAVRKQKFNQQYFISDILKTEGNLYYSRGEYTRAAQLYEQALSIFQYVKCVNYKEKTGNNGEGEIIQLLNDGENNDQREIKKQILLQIYLNLAACYLKFEDYQNSYSACKEALQIDPNNIKALYRRAKALSSKSNATQEDYFMALKDLQKAHKLIPKDQIIYEEYNTIKNEYDKIKTDRILFKGIFENSKNKHHSNCHKIQNSNEVSHNHNHNTQGNCEVSPQNDRNSISDAKSKCIEIFQLCEGTSSMQDDDKTKMQHKKLLKGKRQMENANQNDFSQQSSFLIEIVDKYGFDLPNPAIKQELIKISKQNDDDFKNFYIQFQQ